MQRVFVRRHPRRHRTPRQKVHDSERVLRRVGHDGDLDAVCWVEVSDQPSQVVAPEGGFRAGHCSVVVIEPADMADEVQRATSLQHEAVHARQIRAKGAAGVSDEHEIAAHQETIRFLRDWREQETKNRPVWCTEHEREEPIRSRIDEVIAEERESIRLIREGTYYE